MSDALLSAFLFMDDDSQAFGYETITQGFSSTGWTDINLSSKFSAAIAHIRTIGDVNVGGSSSYQSYTATGMSSGLVVRDSSSTVYANLLVSYGSYCKAAASMRITSDGTVAFSCSPTNLGSTNVWLSGCNVFFICFY